jgi:hypothetical protein
MFTDKLSKTSSKHAMFALDEKAKARKSDKEKREDHRKDEFKESAGKSKDEKERGFVKVFSGKIGKSVRNTVFVRDAKGARPDLVGAEAEGKHDDEAEQDTTEDFATFLAEDENTNVCDACGSEL